MGRLLARDPEPETTSFPLFANHPNHTLVLLDNRLANIKTQPGPVHSLSASRTNLLKTLENDFLKSLRDTRTMILHRYFNPLTINVFRVDLDRAARRCEPQRI